MIPRAVDQVFANMRIAGEPQEQHRGGAAASPWEFEVKASFLEIYNEELRDLLFASERGASKQKAPALRIKKDRGELPSLIRPSRYAFISSITHRYSDLEQMDARSWMDCVQSL